MVRVDMFTEQLIDQLIFCILFNGPFRWQAEFCLPPAFTLSLFFDPEDGGDISLRNVS
jgi:hypothetical protein